MRRSATGWGSGSAVGLFTGVAIAAGVAFAAETTPPRPPAPTLTLAALRDQAFRVAGQLAAEPETPYQILLLVVGDCPAGNPGTNFVGLGNLGLRTDTNGYAAFTQAFEVGLNDTHHVVARTMDASGDTSELSACRPVSVELTYWEDVAVRLDDTAGVARPGEPFPFVITIENRSETAVGRPEIRGLTVTFPVPEGARYVSSSEGGVFDGATVRFADLTVPAEGELRLTVTVLPLLAEVLTATATVDDPGPYQSNNRATLELAVDQSGVKAADLALSLTAAPPSVRAGMELRYTLSITNGGPDDAPRVVVTDRLPETVRWLRAAASQGSAVFANGVVTCELGAMTNGASAQVLVAVQPGAEGALTNVASVSVPSGIPDLGQASSEAGPLALAGGIELARDPNPTNNEATVVVQVLPGQPLEPVGAPAFNPQTGLYEQVVRFTNAGTVPLAGLRLGVHDVASGVLVLNRSGLEEGRSYLQLGRAVEVAETFEFTVEFYRPDRQPVSAPTYEAAEVPGGNAEPPPAPGDEPLVLGGEVEESRFVLSWGAVPGKTYVVQGRPTLPEPWRTAGPALTTTTGQGRWVEGGASSSNAAPWAARFFRVLELP